LASLPKGLQNRLIAEFLKASGVKEPDSDHISLVRAVALSQKPSARASLPGGIVVQRRYDRLVTLNGEQTPAAQILPCPGRVTFGNCTVVCEPAEPGEPDAVCPVGVMTVRSRKSGDSLRLPGGSKTLKKLYIDRKIPADRRPFLAVVADEAGVLAVESIGLAEDRKHGEPAVRIKFL
jgi:tRNA(Ile)-lysidine synthase